MLSNNKLKIIAMLAMLLDHIGRIILPQYDILTIIGRISYPIFAYMIAEGCFYTKNRRKYFSTIAILGIACQIVSAVAQGTSHMNILLTFSLSILTVYAVIFPGMAQFHPMKFLSEISKNLKVYTNTFINKLDGTYAISDKGKIRAKRVIVATHFPFMNKHGLYFAKQYQRRSYVIAYENAPKLNCTANGASDGFYFRNYKNLLIAGGGGHRTGKRGGSFATVEEFVNKNFPNTIEKYRWANQDCVTLDTIPYIGKYGNGTQNIYVATGFNLWGMTSSMTAARILCDMIMDRQNSEASVFDTNRSIIQPKLFSNILETIIDLARPTAPRCPHMGCALQYNKAEHSWDCPCHGSRFNKDGTLIDNPAMRDIKM